MDTSKRKLVIKGMVFILVVFLIFVLSRFGPQPLNLLGPLLEEVEDVEEIYSRREQIKRFLQSFGPYSSAIFILSQALQVVASPIPGELTGVVGGYVYGKVYGFLFSSLGLTLGSWLAFELARILGRPFAETFVSKKFLRRFNFVTTNTGTVICFLLFIFPGFPKDSLCYVLGLSRLRLVTFLIVSTIGRMPGTYFLTVQGASIRSHDYWSAVIIAAISAAVFSVAYIYRSQLFRWIKTEWRKSP